ncbi:MAG: NADH-quinone oxidoreductase subunit NuoH [Thermomicrobiales bacterium]|nr:NADH-quinone oxidoreductase subunit NuoH [Thermomicrobiales bacterium]MCO5219667.1 NADH-quinone oxidoreductase subunit NuoH [Thermomicrobiales bacterium]MCO5226201.1 NADH-quinone oxidoreductase subunit NuoH [Thermomicrobiales bacterium]MCO5228371.1 NADH-quinone oxidoreductase subunit NuoH [Thermomicrobiales bacterium]
MGDQPIWITFIVTFVIMIVLLTSMAYTTWYERKVLARFQDRIGPTRTGPAGLLQPLADAVKLMGKEDLIPEAADRKVFYFAPMITFITAILAAAVIPWGGTIELFGQSVNLYPTDLNVGALFILATGSIGVYGIILGGWSSGNRYSLLGAIRSAAQVISYELILGFSLVGIFIITGTMSLKEIMFRQHETISFGPFEIANWFVLSQPLAFVLFVIAAVAETNRAPFDLPEAESELVAGFMTEYSAMRFALYFLGEYISMIIMSLFASTLFLGGTSGPGADTYWPLGIMWLVLKAIAFLFFYIWLRATLPRFRFDQLMGLAWKVLLPLAILNIALTAFFRLIGNGQVF